MSPRSTIHQSFPAPCVTEPPHHSPSVFPSTAKLDDPMGYNGVDFCEVALPRAMLVREAVGGGVGELIGGEVGCFVGTIVGKENGEIVGGGVGADVGGAVVGEIVGGEVGAAGS